MKKIALTIAAFALLSGVEASAQQSPQNSAVVTAPTSPDTCFDDQNLTTYSAPRCPDGKSMRGVTSQVLLSDNDCSDFYALAWPNGREAGNVHIALLISAEGKVTKSRIAQSSGNPHLDQAALNCVQDWVYAPARRDGQSIAMVGFPVITFKPPRQ